MALQKDAALIDALKGNAWQVELCSSPCAAPVTCLGGCFCSCCMIYSQRKDILAITNEPYYCLGGACTACSVCPCCRGCAEPVDESMVPCCLGLESCCCCTTALQVNRYLIQTRFGKENSSTDDCIVMCAVCLQTIAACAQCFACLWNCYNDIAGDQQSKVDEQQCQNCANTLTLLSDCLNLTVLGCMLTQQQVEVDYMKSVEYQGCPPQIFSLLPPQQQMMIGGGMSDGYVRA